MNILIDGQTLETEEINRGIGVYFKNVLYNMIQYTTGNIWYISVSNIDALKKIDAWVANRLTPIVKGEFAPSFDYSREDIFSDALNSAIEEYNIDCMWIPNPLMVNVLFPNKTIKCPIYATIHDLIPYVMPIKEWGENVKSEYSRRLSCLQDINLLCVSDATRQDVYRCVEKEIPAYVTIEAANNRLFYRKRDKINNTDTVKVLFTGGFDYRKNIYGAVEAFALAKRKVQHMDVKFYIICKYAEHERIEFEKRLEELGISEDVILTGFIPDEELADMYYEADVFFFPSLYEGFGLPLLEAMLGGAYILSADNSSLPEVCGEHALYCNAKSIVNMADMLVKAINNSLAETVEDKNKRQEYALTFSWKKTALQTYNAMENSFVQDKCKRKKIAIVTPWPKQQTGIATYVYKLLPYLNKYFDVDIFADNTLDQNVTLLANEYGGRYLIGDLHAKKDEYDEIIFQIGNSTQHHSEVYRMFKKYNGIAEIHDYQINPFFYHSYYLKGETELYHQALIDGYGIEGEECFAAMSQNHAEPDGNKFPMCHSVSNIAKKTIVHNEWSYHRLGNGVDKYYIPLACFGKNLLGETDRYKAYCNVCHRMGYKEGDFVIGTFGWVNMNKRPDVIIKSISKLVEMGYKIKMVFFGQSNIESLDEMIKDANLQDNIKVMGYLTEAEYQVGMEMCDVVINLRFPTMGESSATLCEAFMEGKPVIVTGINQYLEFPNDVCWKLSVNQMEVNVLTEMIKYLIEHEEVREQMGTNARAYAHEVLACENIAKLYAQVI